MMKSLCEELGVKYKNNGSLVIGFNDEERATINSLLERGILNGVEGLRVIEKEELKRIEPNISNNVTCALLAPTGAIVCPYDLTIAAIGNAMDNGAELKCNFKVSEIILEIGFLKPLICFKASTAPPLSIEAVTTPNISVVSTLLIFLRYAIFLIAIMRP